MTAGHVRIADAQKGIGPRFFTNDEIFSFSHGLADPELTHANLCDIAPDWFTHDTVRTNPDALVDTLLAMRQPGVYHPVRGRDSFKRAVVSRVTENMGFLRMMADSIACPSKEDLAEIVAEVDLKFSEALHRAQRVESVERLVGIRKLTGRENA